jgi:hypothetical protein
MPLRGFHRRQIPEPQTLRRDLQFFAATLLVSAVGALVAADRAVVGGQHRRSHGLVYAHGLFANIMVVASRPAYFPAIGD